MQKPFKTRLGARLFSGSVKELQLEPEYLAGEFVLRTIPANQCCTTIHGLNQHMEMCRGVPGV
eukprot:1320689-Amphidinium_carterae.1